MRKERKEKIERRDKVRIRSREKREWKKER